MPDLTRNLRARSLQGAGMLLAIAGLTAAGLENVSFGHEHLAGGHGVYHHHLYFGSHEHHDADHDRDHHHGEPADHDHDEPSDHDHEAPARTATVSAAPALFQPAGLQVLPVPLENPSALVLSLAPPLVVRPAALPALPRGPPFSFAVS